jgi:hypothetical protein
MFGAAYTKQGGVDHINEQPHTYWAKLFAKFGYTPYDFFRPTFWGDDDIEFWYQQNTFLYVNNNSSLNSILKDAGFMPVTNIEFLNCVHPQLYETWVSRADNSIRKFAFMIRSIGRTIRKILMLNYFYNKIKTK